MAFRGWVVRRDRAAGAASGSEAWIRRCAVLHGASRQAAHYTDEGARWTGPAPHGYNGVLDERP